MPTSETSRPQARSRTISSCLRATSSRIDDADVVLYLGGGFQPALEDAVGGA